MINLLILIILIMEMLLLLKFLLVDLNSCQEIRIEIAEVFWLLNQILLIFICHTLAIFDMFLIKVAALEQHRASTCTCH